MNNEYETRIVKGLQTLRYKGRIYIAGKDLQNKFGIKLYAANFKGGCFQSYQEVKDKLNLNDDHILHLYHSDIPDFIGNGYKGKYYLSYLYIHRFSKFRKQNVDIFTKDIKKLYKEVENEYEKLDAKSKQITTEDYEYKTQEPLGLYQIQTFPYEDNIEKPRLHKKRPLVQRIKRSILAFFS